MTGIMKQVSIQIPFDDEKLEALKIFLSQKDQTAETVIGELIDGLYRKTVPLKVRVTSMYTARLNPSSLRFVRCSYSVDLSNI